MDYVQKLPFVLSILSSILVGLIGYSMNMEMNEIYLRMVLGIVVMFPLGLYIRSIIEKIYEEMEEKKAKELQEEQKLAATKKNAGDHDGNRLQMDVDPQHFKEFLKQEGKMNEDEEFKPMSVKRVTVNEQNKD
jgi:hypothetical protein